MFDAAHVKLRAEGISFIGQSRSYQRQ